MAFSDRMGLRSTRQALQIDSIDKPLRLALYNYLHHVIVVQWWDAKGDYGYGCAVGRKIWVDYWRQRVDKFDTASHVFAQVLHDYIDDCPWYEVYDFVEFCFSIDVARLEPDKLNELLERDMSGYRVRDRIFVPITDSTELDAIDEALAADDAFKGARQHIVEALIKLSLRPNPDLRNAITEAVSAVESAARVVTGKHKATLGDALKVLDKSGHVHPALREAWLKLYGYTSDEGGLRHAMIEDPDIDFATAKYMLVSCAAFVNLLASRL